MNSSGITIHQLKGIIINGNDLPATKILNNILISTFSQGEKDINIAKLNILQVMADLREKVLYQVPGTIN